MTSLQCSTCLFWDKRYPENQKIGVCQRMGVMKWGNEVSISISGPGQPPITDVEAVRTPDNFGCRYHSDSAANSFF